MKKLLTMFLALTMTVSMNSGILVSGDDSGLPDSTYEYDDSYYYNDDYEDPVETAYKALVPDNDGFVVIPAKNGTFDEDLFSHTIYEGKYKKIKAEGKGTYYGWLSPGKGYTLILDGINITGGMYVDDDSDWTLTNCKVGLDGRYKIKLGSRIRLDMTGSEINGKVEQMSEGNSSYGNEENIYIKGGYWHYYYMSDGKTFEKKHSTIRLSHCNKITFKDMQIDCGQYGHSVEMIACSNLMIDHCSMKNQGVVRGSKSVEEPLQIEIASPKNAPNLPNSELNGLACKNVTIQNCTIDGNRGICCNYDSKNKKYQKAKSFHKNVTIKNNKVTGYQSEPIAVFNTANLKITGNTCVNKSKRSNKVAYSTGINVQIIGSGMSTSRMGSAVIKNNTAKGGRQAICATTHNKKVKYKKFAVTGNKCWCKVSNKEKTAIHCDAGKKNVVKKNKCRKW